MHPTIAALHERAKATLERLRAAGQTDRANRFAGRAEVAITRACARLGEPPPVLYVTQSERGLFATTWPGNVVAPLEVTGTAPAFGGRLTCYACTIEGRRYHGRGLGPGLYLRLHPGKRVEPLPGEQTHWGYGSGMVGCLFDNGPCFVETREQAIESALFIFDDLPKRELQRARAALRADGIHYFSRRYRGDAGADLVQIWQEQGPCPEQE